MTLERIAKKRAPQRRVGMFQPHASVGLTPLSSLQKSKSNVTKPMKKRIPQYILEFCQEISDQDPRIIPLRPIAQKPLNECLTIVPEHITKHGGKQKFGWCIHVWKGVLVEAEFHCVWETPEGNLVDLTPKKEHGDAIIFIPDPDIKYTGVQIENIRKPLTNNPDVKEFIQLFEEYFQHMNKGDLATQYGLISISDENIINLAQRMVEVEQKIVKKFGNHRTLAT